MRLRSPVGAGVSEGGLRQRRPIVPRGETHGANLGRLLFQSRNGRSEERNAIMSEPVKLEVFSDYV